jgi:hypothetical protein
MRWAVNVVSISKMRERKETTKCQTETREAKRLLEFLSKHRWEDNNKMDVAEIEHHIRARMEFRSYKIRYLLSQLSQIVQTVASANTRFFCCST